MCCSGGSAELHVCVCDASLAVTGVVVRSTGSSEAVVLEGLVWWTPCLVKSLRYGVKYWLSACVDYVLAGRDGVCRIVMGPRWC
jgi:hypothetical protein